MTLTRGRCAGLDVHQKSVTAAVRLTTAEGGERAEVETFRTTTQGLRSLAAWLGEREVRLAGMEATGVYWKPVFYGLEGSLECWLLNAQHVKNLPGKKTDVADATWLAELLEAGHVRPSFVPPRQVRDLRDLTRQRKAFIQERTRMIQRLDKVLEDAGLKLSSVTAHVLGVSTRAMIEALIAGQRDPEILANLARGRLRAKLPELREALEGNFREHHAFLGRQLLDQIDALDASIDRISARVAELTAPEEELLALLDTVPGISRRTAEIVLAEVGPGVAAFPSAHHLASWAGLCPGNNESAGKHRTGRTRKGNGALRSALVEAALAAIRVRDSYLYALYSRLRGRRGHKKAVVAVAHAMLGAIYHILLERVPFKDLGHDYFLKRDAERQTRRLVHQLETLGHKVTLEPAA